MTLLHLHVRNKALYFLFLSCTLLAKSPSDINQALFGKLVQDSLPINADCVK